MHQYYEIKSYLDNKTRKKTQVKIKGPESFKKSRKIKVALCDL